MTARGSKPFTSAAMRVENPDASKIVIGAPWLRPGLQRLPRRRDVVARRRDEAQSGDATRCFLHDRSSRAARARSPRACPASRHDAAFVAALVEIDGDRERLAGGMNWRTLTSRMPTTRASSPAMLAASVPSASIRSVAGKTGRRGKVIGEVRRLGGNRERGAQPAVRALGDVDRRRVHAAEAIRRRAGRRQRDEIRAHRGGIVEVDAGSIGPSAWSSTSAVSPLTSARPW
jgi:hypothetical protein